MRYFLFICLLALTITSCKKDNGSLELNFKAIYNNQPLVLFETLDYADTQMFLTQSDFYISDISIAGEDGELNVKEIDFVSFNTSNLDLESAQNGFSLNYSEIPAGSYNKLKFSIGVPPRFNSSIPSNFSSSSPLSNSGYYWSAWESYIFAKVQGKIETEAPEDFDLGFFFHTGKDEMVRDFEVDIEFVIEENSNSVIQISMDHLEFFRTGTNEFFDIPSSPTNHDPNNLGPIEMVVDNYSNALSFRSL